MFVVTGLNNQPFFILVIEDVLIGRVLEHSLPGRVIKVRKVIGGCGDCGKPIVKNDMELRSDVAGLRIQNERNRTCVLVGKTKVARENLFS